MFLCWNDHLASVYRQSRAVSAICKCTHQQGDCVTNNLREQNTTMTNASFLLCRRVHRLQNTIHYYNTISPNLNQKHSTMSSKEHNSTNGGTQKKARTDWPRSDTVSFDPGKSGTGHQDLCRTFSSPTRQLTYVNIALSIFNFQFAFTIQFRLACLPAGGSRPFPN